MTIDIHAGEYQAVAMHGALRSAPAPQRAPSIRDLIAAYRAAGRAWDAANPRAVAAARTAVRGEPGPWLRAQLERRRKHLRRAAQALGLDPDAAEGEGFASLMPTPADREVKGLSTPYSSRVPQRPAPGLGDPSRINLDNPGPATGRPGPTGIDHTMDGGPKKGTILLTL